MLALSSCLGTSILNGYSYFIRSIAPIGDFPTCASYTFVKMPYAIRISDIEYYRCRLDTWFGEVQRSSCRCAIRFDTINRDRCPLSKKCNSCALSCSKITYTLTICITCTTSVFSPIPTIKLITVSCLCISC